MNPKFLETFLIFADELSFSEVARIVGCSQPAVYAQILQLQEEVGRPLYWREQNRLQLTQDGHRLAVFCRDLQERLLAIREGMSDDRAAIPIVLAAHTDVQLFLVRPVLDDPEAAAGSPVHLRAFEAELSAYFIRQAKAHLAIIETDLPPADLQVTELARFGYDLCAPPESPLPTHLSGRGLWAEIAKLPLLLPDDETPLRRKLNRLGQAYQLEWNLKLEVPVADLLLQFVSLGLGYAIVPSFCQGAESLQRMPLDGLAPLRLFLIERHIDSHNTGYHTLRQRLIDYVRGF